MLEGFYPAHPPHLTAPIQTASAAVLAAVSQPQGPRTNLPLLSQQQPAQQQTAPQASVLAGPLFQALQRQQPQPQHVAPPQLVQGAETAAAAAVEALVAAGCSKREAEVAWDIVTLWRLLRAGCDPAFGQYFLPLQHYTRQPALIVKLQSCKTERQLAMYIVRLVHGFRKQTRRGEAQGEGQKRSSLEQGVQLLNQLLRVLSGAGGGEAKAPNHHPQQHQQQPAAAMAPAQQGTEQQPVELLLELPLMYPQAQQGGGGDLWGHEVVMGIPHAVLLPNEAGVGVAESAVLGTPRSTDFIGDFLS